MLHHDQPGFVSHPDGQVEDVRHTRSGSAAQNSHDQQSTTSSANTNSEADKDGFLAISKCVIYIVVVLILCLLPALYLKRSYDERMRGQKEERDKLLKIVMKSQEIQERSEKEEQDK